MTLSDGASDDEMPSTLPTDGSIRKVRARAHTHTHYLSLSYVRTYKSSCYTFWCACVRACVRALFCSFCSFAKGVRSLHWGIIHNGARQTNTFKLGERERK